MSIFLYAWVKSDLETRAREEHIKCDIGKLTFPRQTDSIVAMPCAHKLWDAQKEEVVKRYNSIHEVEVRANILCPICKNRITYIAE